MGDVGTDKPDMQLAGTVDIVSVAAHAGDELLIFFAANRCADTFF